MKFSSYEFVQNIISNIQSIISLDIGPFFSLIKGNLPQTNFLSKLAKIIINIYFINIKITVMN